MAANKNEVQYYNISDTASNKEWRWRLVSRNGRIVAASSEGFDSIGNAKRNFNLALSMMKSPFDVVICNKV